MEKSNQSRNVVRLIRDNPLFLGSSFFAKIARKSAGLRFVIRGKISPMAFLANFLPFSLRPKSVKKDVYCLQSLVLDDFAGDYLKEPVNLSGFDFYYRREEGEQSNFLDAVSFMDLVGEIVVSDQYAAEEFVKDDSVVIDAGANIGIFSAFTASLSPRVKVFAFEPSEQNCKTMRKTIEANDLNGRIELFNEALGDRRGAGNLMINEIKESNDTLEESGYGENSAARFKVERVFVNTIDDFVENRGLKRVDFIKIDTEGYEKQILKGAAKTIGRFSPVISCAAYHFPNDEKEITKLVFSINNRYALRVLKRNEKDIVFYPKSGVRKLL